MYLVRKKCALDKNLQEIICRFEQRTLLHSIFPDKRMRNTTHISHIISMLLTNIVCGSQQETERRKKNMELLVQRLFNCLHHEKSRKRQKYLKTTFPPYSSVYFFFTSPVADTDGQHRWAANSRGRVQKSLYFSDYPNTFKMIVNRLKWKVYDKYCDTNFVLCSLSSKMFAVIYPQKNI